MRDYHDIEATFVDKVHNTFQGVCGTCGEPISSIAEGFAHWAHRPRTWRQNPVRSPRKEVPGQLDLLHSPPSN